MMRFLESVASYTLVELAIIAAIILVGRRTARITTAPGLDAVASALTWIPWGCALWWSGAVGLAGCVIGQMIAMQVFCFWHKARYGRPGPTIARTLNRLTGPVRNNLALLATLPALPAFWLIRFSQLTTYPILVRAVRLPPYNHGEWVSVSRQKFQGLVGHDLVWCLYCDWMTGIYALGGEMLRNLESFWCPIRFYPGKKCENCKIDFPDIPAWVPPDGTMAQVEAKLLEKYEGRRWNSWWAHPERKGEGKATPLPPQTRRE
jgi:hypothetical protein